MMNHPAIFDIRAELVAGPANQAGNTPPGRPHIPDDLLFAINLLNLGVLTVGCDGRINFANRAAEDILLSHDSLICPALPRTETLHGSGTQERRLNRAIRSRIQAADVDCLTLQIHGKQPLFVVAFRHGNRQPGSGSSRNSVLFITELTGARELDCRPVAGFYGLTRAETRLLDALLKGEKITDYARRANVTINTVKGHLSRLFRKTQTSRQSELVLRVLANPLFGLFLTPASKPRT